MKIFRIIARLNVGGPARHVVWLTAALPRPEFESVLIAGTVPTGEEDMCYFAAENGVEPIYLPELSRELSPKDLISFFKIFREMVRQRPDIIHTHTAKAGTVGRLAGLVYKWVTWRTLIGRPRPVKIIHTFHGHVFHSYYGRFKTSIFLLIERILARIATDKIIVITDQQFREIHLYNGVGAAEQFSVIPLGIDLKHFGDAAEISADIKNEIGTAADDLMVGFIGRLTEIKNIPLFLEALGHYNARGEPGLPRMRAVIIGDGHLRGELERQAENLGLNETVRFLGNRADVCELLAGIDIVALTSKNEGSPLSLIEAMAAGKPVISTAVGGVVDLLGDQVARFDGFAVCERGIAVEPDSPKKFCNGLIYMAKDAKLRERLSINGKQHVTAGYSVDRLVTDIASLYRGVWEPQK